MVMARKFRTGPAAGVDDLVSVAAAEVLRARKRFDPKRGVRFKTFAALRARGAMVDELRRLDHASRRDRQIAKREGREIPPVLSIDSAPRDVVPKDIRDAGAADPVWEVARREYWRSLGRLVGERQANLLDQYFRQDLTMKEIGRRHGLSESRVCQLINRAIAALRKKGGDLR